jgi:hypothetical protein
VDVKARARAAHERCPYCHDLTENQRLAEIECPACQTTHHRACIQELGRCSVYGCEEPIDPGSGDEIMLRESPAMRKIRARYRDRARQFVRNNTRDLRGQIEEALEFARISEAERHWEAAAEAYSDLAYLERRAIARRDRSLETIVGRMTAAAARAKARKMRSKHVDAVVLKVLLTVGGVVVGVAVLTVLTIAVFG